MLVTKTLEFDMAHRLMHHDGLCKNLHGHRYRVDITFAGEVQPEAPSTSAGMVLDFKEIKEKVKTWLDNTFDHACMLHQHDVDLIQVLEKMGLRLVKTQFQPTAENMAQYFFGEITKMFEGRPYNVEEVTVYETPTSYATFKNPVTKLQSLVINNSSNENSQNA